MWIDLPGWQPVTSFTAPVAPPGTEPDAAPLVCVQFNADWLPYVVGALMQLVQPAAWATSDPTVLQTTLEQATGLISTFGVAEDCTMLTFRFTDTCVLQFSLDGGVTWEDVSGWPTYAPGCYTGATGATGPAGPAGTFDPGTPIAQPGQSTDELACSVAGYIATVVIQQAMSSVISGIDAANTIIDIAGAVLGFFIGGAVVAGIATAAVNTLYNAILAGNKSHYEAASTDPTLWGDVTCAIYTATSADGYVTSGNYAAVLAAICAISYTYPDVVSGICEYLTELGESGLLALQVPGALEVADCSACGGPSNWCYLWDFTVATGAWFNPYGTSCCGVWTSGTGWVGQDDGTNVEVDIQIPVSGGGTIDSIEFNAAIFNTPGPSNFIGWHDSGGWHSTAPTLTNDGEIHTYGALPALAGIDMLWIRIMTVSPSASPPFISAVSVRGHGAPNPFGTTNCV